MATTTANYGLQKPARGDSNWDVALNGNFDNIDVLLKDREDGIDNLGSQMADIPNQSYITEKAKQVDLDTVNTNLQNIKADKTYVDNKVASIASGSPDKTFATLADLNTAYPTGDSKNKLVASDGHIYNWDGSSWIDTGIQYQSTGIALGSISPILTSFFIQSQNLFNRNTIISGNILDINSGTLVTLASWSVSDWIPISPSTVYTRAYDNKIVFYDSSKNYISGYDINTGHLTVTTPSNAAYIRMVTYGDGHSDMLVQGNTLPSSYIPYQFTFNKNSSAYPLKLIDSTDIPINSINTDALQNNSITADKLKILIKSQNLFNRNTITPNTALDINLGTTYSAAGWNSSDYIPIFDNTTYIRNYDTHVVFYNINKQFISSYDNNSGHQSFTTPSNAAYLRLTVYSTTIATSTYMLVQGTSLPVSFVPFSFSFNPSLNILFNDPRFNTLFKWTNKNWLAIGDSITAFLKYQPLVQNLCQIGNVTSCATPGISLRNMMADVTANMVNNADLISIYCVANDFGGNRPLGTMADDKTVQSFYGDVKNAIDIIMNFKPTARLVFILTTRIGTFTGGGDYPTYPNPNGSGSYQKDYNNVVIDVCNYYGIPVLDLYSNGGINQYNWSVFTADNLHPNDAGFAVLAPIIASFFNRI